MLTIEPIPAFNDNYIWCLRDSQAQMAYIVDPGDAAVVEQWLQQHQLQLAGIMITHHHHDHIGGLPALLANHTVPVYGPRHPSIPYVSTVLAEGDQCTLLDITFTVLATPGHTLDHIAFYADQGVENPLLFCGDTLFTGGCGRLFEGTAEQLYHALQRLAALDDNTQVYCAHEYTLANLAFAQQVEPDNAQLAQRLQDDSARRQQGKPTVPASLALEKATNPFLRCHIANVIKSVVNYAAKPCPNSVAVFASLREWKDNS